MTLDKKLQNNSKDLQDLQEHINLIGATYAFDMVHAVDPADNINSALQDAVKLINKNLDEILNYEIQAGDDVNDWARIDNRFNAICDTTNWLLAKVQKEIANYYDERGYNLRKYMQARQALIESVQKALETKTIED